MKTPVGTLALIGAVLMAGSALAQTAPRGPAPPPGTTPPPAVGSVPPGQPGGQTRGTGVGGGVPDAPPSIETGQLLIKSKPRPPAAGQNPTDGVGGMGGGRLSSPPTTPAPIPPR